MTRTTLTNPLVHDYLRDLRVACATLPAAQARELREQITAHLEEALPPEASDAEVAAELRKLGPARSLAAEAAGPVPLTAAARLRNLLSHVRWWGWAAIAATVAVIAAVAAYLILVLNAAPLQQDGLTAWWFPQDTARSVETSAAGVSQLTVPERYGQQQGFVVGISNDSDWTQTILGPAGSWEPALASVQLAVGSSPAVDEGGDWNNQTRWDLPGSIPPHSYRLLRVVWTSDFCNNTTGTTIVQDVPLRVRVGAITRTEVIQLDFAMALAGPAWGKACGQLG